MAINVGGHYLQSLVSGGRGGKWMGLALDPGVGEEGVTERGKATRVI